MQQITLSDRITKVDCDSLGKYFSEISREHLLTLEEEADLVRRIKSGDQAAKDKLVKANLRFVVSVAKHYQNGPVPLSDLINEGNIGLIKAAERFDETRGFKFISYAVWWIRQSILAALDEQSRLIKVPSNRIAIMSRIRKVRDSWEKQHERTPTNAELAEEIGMDEDELKEVISSFSSETSLDAPYGKNGESSLLEFVSNRENDNPGETSLNFEQIKGVVKEVLSRLSERERDVVEMSFGINHATTNSLDEISTHLGISRERIRQIREKALKKLSYHGLRKRIKPLTFT